MLDLRFSQRWLKSTAFWVVTLCSSERSQHFKGTYCLHRQVKRISQARKQGKQSASYSLTLKMEVICSSKTSLWTTQKTILFTCNLFYRHYIYGNIPFILTHFFCCFSICWMSPRNELSWKQLMLAWSQNLKYVWYMDLQASVSLYTFTLFT
jgi:hypothetical protein